jgi:hypothetical protein
MEEFETRLDREWISCKQGYDFAGNGLKLIAGYLRMIRIAVPGELE